jgi:hypothetical protein
MKTLEYVQAALVLLTVSFAAGCKGRAVQQSTGESLPSKVRAGPVIIDTNALADATVASWFNQYALPWISASRVMVLAAPLDVPRFSSVGPVVDGDSALLGSSQLGFVAIRWRQGSVAWSKPAGMHLAPPLMMQGSWQLISDCPAPMDSDDDQIILGCLRTVSHDGTDLSLMPIVGQRAGVAEFSETSGPQQTWTIEQPAPQSQPMIGWQRGDTAIAIDSITGKASLTKQRAGEIYADIKGERVQFALADEQLVARRRDGQELWRLHERFAALIGVIWGSRYEAPMLRLVRVSTRLNPRGEIDLLDVDATGSKHGQAAFPTPGIALLGRHSSVDGATAFSVRVDSSLQHDLVVGYSASGERRWAFALPEIPRADPVGIAVTGDAVLVFHDGDRVSVLPALN